MLDTYCIKLYFCISLRAYPMRLIGLVFIGSKPNEQADARPRLRGLSWCFAARGVKRHPSSDDVPVVETVSDPSKVVILKADPPVRVKRVGGFGGAVRSMEGAPAG